MWAVTDVSNHCVWIFDRKNQLVRKFGSKGSGSVEFNSLYGIAFDDNNHLYVTDYFNHRVQKYDIGNKYLMTFGTSTNCIGRGNGEVSGPVGITVHGSKVYVVENGNNRVSVFQCNGQFLHIIGAKCLERPWYIAVNANYLLVADMGHECISIFTLDGNYVGNYDTKGTTKGQLNYPCGIAINIYGYIFVTEYYNGHILIFDKEGTFIHSFGSNGSGLGQFSLPHGIAISPTGDIYVCDAGNNRIQIFST